MTESSGKNIFSQRAYEKKINEIFTRFPSVQKTSFKEAYKPGLEHMEQFDAFLGGPSKKFRSIHVAGTNGKGSVASMLTSVLAGCGLKTGLYTSPHLVDFRERARIAAPDGSLTLIPEEYVWDFLLRTEEEMDRLDLSFFEITTGLAFKWFADEKVDVAVIEAGLGGRLDSTNIITPDLSVITSIGLDHCDLLGDTLEKIAWEKAGIMKRGVPAVIGVKAPETAPVFTSKAEGFCPLFFADSSYPQGNPETASICEKMDLRGEYQRINVSTALTAADILKDIPFYKALGERGKVAAAIERTAAATGFHGRWEKLSSMPDVIADIGHNPPALKENFRQLEESLADGTYSSITIIYGVMADKDLSGIIPLMPRKADYLFVTPDTSRALPSGKILERFRAWFSSRGLPAPEARDAGKVHDAIASALRLAQGKNALIYIGGSTFVVSEAVTYFSKR